MKFWMVRRRAEREEWVRYEPRGYDKTTHDRSEAKQFASRAEAMASLWAMRAASGSSFRWRLVRVTVKEWPSDLAKATA